MRKLSGLLANGTPDFVVVGIGITVNWAPAGGVALSEFTPGIHLHPADAAFVVIEYRRKAFRTTYS